MGGTANAASPAAAAAENRDARRDTELDSSIATASRVWDALAAARALSLVARLVVGARCATRDGAVIVAALIFSIALCAVDAAPGRPAISVS